METRVSLKYFVNGCRYILAQPILTSTVYVLMLITRRSFFISRVNVKGAGEDSNHYDELCECV